MRNIFFVCLSHTLTAEQISSLETTFGEGDVVLVSSELKARTSQIPATATLQEVQDIACAVVTEAVNASATHFICQGEPTFAMWANIMAGGAIIASWCEGINFMNWSSMKCITSTTERISVDTVQADGSVLKTAVFKHVQWRNLF
jgi:hypothetical protein